MPELPEVETIRRQLNKLVVGKKIKKAVFLGPQKMINLPKNKFLKKLINTKIVAVKRRAKLLILELSNGYNLLTHLKMTGKYLFDAKVNKHTHLVLYFSDKHSLSFQDVRKFGYLKVLKQEEIKKIEKDYGPEPLNNKSFSLEKFTASLLKRKNNKIKQLLMDQTFLAGVGNIYAQEICFYAKIRPDRKVGSLTNKEIKDIYKGLRSILSQAIKYGGTTADDYLDLYGQRGNYTNKLKVYGRSGLSCYRCKTILKESKLGGRGTVYCPKCQK